MLGLHVRRQVHAAARNIFEWVYGAHCLHTKLGVAHTDLHGLSADDFQRIYAVNTIGPFPMMRAAAPHLKATGKGAIGTVIPGQVSLLFAPTATDTQEHPIPAGFKGKLNLNLNYRKLLPIRPLS